MASSKQNLATRPRYARELSSFAGLWNTADFSDDHAITTRGHHLPGIIERRSASSGPVKRRLERRSEDDIESGSGPTSRTRTRASTPGREYGSLTGWDALLFRSQRLIGDSSPRIEWKRYWKTVSELESCSKAVRKYYERNNGLILRFAYIDRLLDSSIPRRLIHEYTHSSSLPDLESSHLHKVALSELTSLESSTRGSTVTLLDTQSHEFTKIQRTPRNLFRVPENETIPNISQDEGLEEEPLLGSIEAFLDDEIEDSNAAVVTYAIYMNLVANVILLVGKIIVTIMSSSVSVLASLVDAILDFLSTIIIWVTTYLISQHRRDRHKYPVGRRRLEPIGVLIFSIIMITSFSQVAIEAVKRLSGPHMVAQLNTSAIVIMTSTIAVKFGCWLWCRLITNSSVQVLAQDAMTDVIFNTCSIIFPLVGSVFHLWWLDPLGGMLLSVYIMVNWGSTSSKHIANLTGKAANLDERNVILYLTMRFAGMIKQIQGLNVYHTGDKLNVEVDIILDEATTLRDSHDLGESLQYVLESVPSVDRAFVHMDYKDWNLPTHLDQQA